jgi:hypothetical protein
MATLNVTVASLTELSHEQLMKHVLAKVSSFCDFTFDISQTYTTRIEPNPNNPEETHFEYDVSIDLDMDFYAD